MRHIRNNDGIAIILVISILAVLTSLGAAFMYAARLEAIKTLHFREGMRAGYIAEAGLSHAKELLREDKLTTPIDTNTETWRAAFLGSDVDNDDDGVAEAKWIGLVDSDGELYGRYAVTVVDEAGRINVNSAGFHNENPLRITEGYSTFEVSLNKFFTAKGIGSAESLRDEILSYRYGGNYPGESLASIDDNLNNAYLAYDGLDNDADGLVDEALEGVNEPQEFVGFYPYGDDRPFYSIFELRNIAAIKPHFDEIKPYVSVHAFDHNVNKDGVLRIDVNQASVLEINNAFLSSGLTDSEQWAVNVADYRDKDNESTFLFARGKSFYGVEGVRINELMIDPRYGYQATTLTNITGPGGDWGLSGEYYANSNPTVSTTGKGIWRFGGIRPGTYYLRMLGRSSGDIIGDVKVGLDTHASMSHGELFIHPVTVGVDGKLDITIYNKEIDKGETFTTYFKSFQLLEGPDAEYIELLNITNKDIDVSGWTVEGLRVNDLIATIPPGTVIKSFDYLVLAVDKDDLGVAVPVNIRNNDISLLHTWAGSLIDPDRVCQLSFDTGLSREDDILSNSPSAYGTVVRLRTSAGKMVDQVEYTENYFANVAFERGDPASVEDRDGDSLFDGWAVSDGFPLFAPIGTPTAENRNLSVSGHLIGGLHSEIRVKNGELASVGEVANVSKGDRWEHITTDDIMRFCDRMTTMSVHCEAEGHLGSGGGWSEMTRASPYSNWYFSSSQGDVGEWVFDWEDRLLNGVYCLTIFGAYEEAFAISVQKKDGSWTEFTPPLTPDITNGVRYGLIDIGGDDPEALPSKTVTLRLRNESASNECHFDYVVFSPINRVDGRINVNTASPEVLQAVPGVTSEVAEAIIAGRPYGALYGIGDILIGDTLGTSESAKKEIFQKLCNIIATKSDVFEILVTGQTFLKGKQVGEKKLRVVVER